MQGIKAPPPEPGMAVARPAAASLQAPAVVRPASQPARTPTQASSPSLHTLYVHLLLMQNYSCNHGWHHTYVWPEILVAFFCVDKWVSGWMINSYQFQLPVSSKYREWVGFKSTVLLLLCFTLASLSHSLKEHCNRQPSSIVVQFSAAAVLCFASCCKIPGGGRNGSVAMLCCCLLRWQHM